MAQSSGSDFEGKTDPDPTLKLMRFHLLILFKIKVYINMGEKEKLKHNNMTVLPPFIVVPVAGYAVTVPNQPVFLFRNREILFKNTRIRHALARRTA